MPTYLKNLNWHSESFLPAFAMVPPVGRGDQGSKVYAALDFHHDGLGPLPAPGENMLARWATLASCLITVTEAGLPVGPQNSLSGTNVKLFDGPCDVILTDQRLLLYVADGPTPLGPLGGNSNRVLIAVFPLDRIDFLSVELKEGIRGTKERNLTVLTMTGTVAALVIEHVELVWEDDSFQRFRGSKHLDVLESMVAPIAAARRSTASGPATQLDNVLSGTRIHTPTEIGAQSATDEPDLIPPGRHGCTLVPTRQPELLPQRRLSFWPLGSRFCTRNDWGPTRCGPL